MKIVQIEDYFHPEAGYQINIISKYFVKAGNSVTIITACMDKIPETLNSFFGVDDIQNKDLEYTKKYGVKIIRLPLYSYVSGRAVFKPGLIEAICRENPDIVFLHDNDKLSSIVGTLQRKKFHCPVVLECVSKCITGSVMQEGCECRPNGRRKGSAKQVYHNGWRPGGTP